MNCGNATVSLAVPYPPLATSGCGLDLYNLAIAGEVAKTVTASRNDTEHIPAVVCLCFA